MATQRIVLLFRELPAPKSTFSVSKLQTISISASRETALKITPCPSAGWDCTSFRSALPCRVSPQHTEVNRRTRIIDNRHPLLAMIARKSFRFFFPPLNVFHPFQYFFRPGVLNTPLECKVVLNCDSIRYVHERRGRFSNRRQNE